MIATGNLLDGIPAHLPTELVTALLEAPRLRIERIVSRGHASTPEHWYDQDRAEWVLLVSGSAGLLFEGEDEPRRLKAGDHILIEAHRRHRVAWTDAREPTIWLAVHFR